MTRQDAVQLHLLPGHPQKKGEVLKVYRRKSGYVHIDRSHEEVKGDRVQECANKIYSTVDDALVALSEAAYWEKKEGKPYPTHWRNCFGELKVLEI